MTEGFITCNGQRLTALRLEVANVGPWIADLDFETAPDVAGAVEIHAAGLVLRGTVIADQSGVHLEQRKVRVVAGGGGWYRHVSRKSYHNDARIKARLVAEDVAREIGETIGDFTPAVERIGVDYVRAAGPASRVLEHVAGDGVPWWVDYEGRTCVGPRAATPLTSESLDVLKYDPRNRTLEFAIEDPGLVQVGAVIAEQPLGEPQTIREFELRVDADHLRVIAWCGGSERERGRLAGLLRAIARRATDERLLGKYRYRVVLQRDDGRLELQAVRRDVGMPDLRLISIWPGVAGAAIKLSPGTEVLVEFVEGDATQPIVTHFVHADGPGFIPIELAFAGSSQRAARQGDLVQSGGVGTAVVLAPVPPAVGGPVTTGVPYLVSFTTNPGDVGPLAKPLFGAISTGSPKVKL